MWLPTKTITLTEYRRLKVCQYATVMAILSVFVFLIFVAIAPDFTVTLHWSFH